MFYPEEHTSDQEWRHRDLAALEAEAKREVAANCEEVKLREDKG